MCRLTASCTCQNLEHRRRRFDLSHILIGWLDRAFYHCRGDEIALHLLRKNKLARKRDGFEERPTLHTDPDARIRSATAGLCKTPAGLCKTPAELLWVFWCWI